MGCVKFWRPGLGRRLTPRPRPSTPQCDCPEAQGAPACTSSRVGDIPVAEIDAVMSASAAAVQEMALLGPQLAVPLLEFGEWAGRVWEGRARV